MQRKELTGAHKKKVSKCLKKASHFYILKITIEGFPQVLPQLSGPFILTELLCVSTVVIVIVIRIGYDKLNLETFSSKRVQRK